MPADTNSRIEKTKGDDRPKTGAFAIEAHESEWMQTGPKVSLKRKRSEDEDKENDDDEETIQLELQLIAIQKRELELKLKLTGVFVRAWWDFEQSHEGEVTAKNSFGQSTAPFVDLHVQEIARGVHSHGIAVETSFGRAFAELDVVMESDQRRRPLTLTE